MLYKLITLKNNFKYLINKNINNKIYFYNEFNEI